VCGCGFLAQALRGVAHRVEIEIEAHDARTPAQHAEAVPSFAAPGVENEIAGVDLKPLEIDGQ
jgi:hypothetical protein